LLVEDWTLRVLEVNADESRLRFELTGSRTGPDGGGVSTERFVSNSGRVVIEPEDWTFARSFELVHQTTPPGFEMTWSVLPMFVDVYREQRLEDRTRELPTTSGARAAEYETQAGIDRPRAESAGDPRDPDLPAAHREPGEGQLALSDTAAPLAVWSKWNLMFHFSICGPLQSASYERGTEPQVLFWVSREESEWDENGHAARRVHSPETESSPSASELDTIFVLSFSPDTGNRDCLSQRRPFRCPPGPPAVL
jgi:hypothetical protein